jgi:hypothetical protein
VFHKLELGTTAKTAQGCAYVAPGFRPGSLSAARHPGKAIIAIGEYKAKQVDF